MASGQFKYQGLHDDSEIPDSTTTNNPDSEPVIPTAPVTTTAPNAPNNSDPAYPPNTPNSTAATPDNPVSASTAPMYPVNTNDPPPLYPGPPSTDANIINQASNQPKPCQAQEYPPPYPGPSTGSNTNQAFQHPTPYDPTKASALPATTQSHAYSPQGPSAPTVYVVNNQQQQGPQAPGVVTIVRQQGIPPQNYMGLAIFSTLCCFFCFGIVAIVKSSQVNTLWAQGKHEEARKAAAWARFYAFAAIPAGILVTTVAVLLRFFAYSSSGSYY